MENKEHTLVVKNLPENIDEGLLLSIFNTNTKIRSIRIMKDIKTKKPRGFAYINFFNEYSLLQAYKEFDNFEWMGKKLEFVLKNEIDKIEKDLNILIYNIETKDKELILLTLNNFGEIFSHKFEDDKDNSEYLRCYVQYKDINSAFNCINNLEKINNKEVKTRFKSDNIIGLKINYNRTYNHIQKILKDILINLKLKYNFSKEKLMNQLFNTTNIFFGNSYDAILYYYNENFQNLIKNNQIFASFIKINKKKKITLKIKNYENNMEIDNFKNFVGGFGEIELFEQKEDYILIQMTDNVSMIELIEKLEKKEEFSDTLGDNFNLFFNKILYKTIKKTIENIDSNEAVFYDNKYLINNFSEFKNFNQIKKKSIWKKILNRLLVEYLNNLGKENLIKSSESMTNEIIENSENDEEFLKLLTNENDKNEIFNILIENIEN